MLVLNLAWLSGVNTNVSLMIAATLRQLIPPSPEVETDPPNVFGKSSLPSVCLCAECLHPADRA